LILQELRRRRAHALSPNPISSGSEIRPRRAPMTASAVAALAQTSAGSERGAARNPRRKGASREKRSLARKHQTSVSLVTQQMMKRVDRYKRNLLK
jgi:hypothetical protein